MLLAMLAMLARIAQRSTVHSPTVHGARGQGSRQFSFAVYLLTIGVVVLVAFSLVRTPTEGTLRYVLMLLFVPIGLVATLLAVEPNRLVRGAVCVLVGLWLVASAMDHVAYARRYLDGEPNEPRRLADALVGNHITVARAPYWIAYKVTFMAGERVKIASTDVVRIQEYQTLADAAGPGVPFITRISESLKQLSGTPDRR